MFNEDLNECQVFWRNLETIKDSLLLDDEKFSQYLGLSYKTYKKALESKVYLPLSCVFELAERLNFHLEDLIDINFKLKTSLQNTNLLERYSHATYSHTKSIINLINYLENCRGIRAKINLLRKFQLSEEFITNPQNKANIFLISDIVEYLKNTYRFSNEEFMAMGQRTPHASDNSFLKSKLLGHTSVQNMYAQFFDDCTHIFDQNCTYRLDSMNENYAIVASIPKKEVLEELGIKLSEFGTDAMAITRCGVISSMTWFQYGRNIPLRRISSTYDGDKYDRYLLDFASFNFR